MEASETPIGRVVGRYALHGEIASGGMATVHFGRLLGEAGFSRTVAIKRLHPQFAKDPEFGAMFLDEARLAARIRHPNVVPTLDVVSTGEELLLVMEYVQGESLSRLVRAVKRRGERIPPKMVAAILSAALHGLHAAHEAKNERGEPLGIVHRDVSPQNILVGIDGVARVLDFGVAKAAGRLQETRSGQLKGKLAYMAPEQLRGDPVDRRTDVYAASIVLWEALTTQRLFDGDDVVVFGKVLEGAVEPPRKLVPNLPPAFDAVVMRGLERDPAKRYQSAREMAIALERCVVPATASSVGEWVERVAGEALAKRAEQIAEMESRSDVDVSSAVRAAMKQSAANATPAPPAVPPSVDPDDAPTRAMDPSLVSSPSLASSPSARTAMPVVTQAAPIAGAPERATTGASSSGAKALAIIAVAAAMTTVLAAIVIATMLRGTPAPAAPALATQAPPPPAATTAATAAPAPAATTAAPPVQATASATAAASAEAPPSAPASTTTAAATNVAAALPAPHVHATAPAEKPPAAPTHAAAPPAPIATQPAAATPPPAPAAKADCDPPYTVDAQGIKHFKPKCL